jgi:hypothetical protein
VKEQSLSGLVLKTQFEDLDIDVYLDQELPEDMYCWCLPIQVIVNPNVYPYNHGLAGLLLLETEEEGVHRRVGRYQYRRGLNDHEFKKPTCPIQETETKFKADNGRPVVQGSKRLVELKGKGEGETETDLQRGRGEADAVDTESGDGTGSQPAQKKNRIRKFLSRSIPHSRDTNKAVRAITPSVTKRKWPTMGGSSR